MMKQLALAAALMATFTGNALAGKTLDTIKQRGHARLRRQSEPAGLLGGGQPG